MGRKAKLTPDQVHTIHKSSLTQKELAVMMDVSHQTIRKAQRGIGTYATYPADLGVPVLDGHGEVVGVNPGWEDEL